MDVYWAALCVHGGRSREWMLLDDCGTVKKETAKSKLPQPRTYVRRLDETYFLIDPQVEFQETNQVNLFNNLHHLWFGEAYKFGHGQVNKERFNYS